MITDFATATAAMSHSPLVRFLAALGIAWLLFKMLLVIADVVIDDMVNNAALAVSLDLADTDDNELPITDPFDWSAPTLADWADLFATTRADIAALETTEERR